MLFSFAQGGPKSAGSRIIIAKEMSRTLWILPGGLWKEVFFSCSFFLPANLPWLYSEGASLPFQFSQQPGGGDIVLALWLHSRAP